jgi:tetratricopeptide (TPR) repeat protein
MRIFMLLLCSLLSLVSFAQSLNPYDVSKVKVDATIDYKNMNDSTINRAYAEERIVQRKYDEAVNFLLKELSSNPQNAVATQRLGFVYSEMGQPEKSLPYFDKAIEMISDEPVYYYNRGLAYYRMKLHAKAIEDYSKAISMSPNDKLAYYNRALAYEDQRKFELAITDYNKDLLINGDRAKVYNNRGLCYMKLGKLDKALEDVNKALELEPQKANAFANRGIIYFKMGNTKKACADFEKATAFGDDMSAVIKQYCK